MTTCETLPMLPDTRVESGSTATSEPMEVGPFTQGRVFLKVMDAEGTGDLERPLAVDVGLSPTGYDDWQGHWDPVERIEIGSEGIHSCPVTNFGNWLRLRLSNDGEGARFLVQAWFVGKG